METRFYQVDKRRKPENEIISYKAGRATVHRFVRIKEEHPRHNLVEYIEINQDEATEVTQKRIRRFSLQSIIENLDIRE